MPLSARRVLKMYDLYTLNFEHLLIAIASGLCGLKLNKLI